ncbi:MAG: UDP-3-O-(3-hydroxymyristoyl)glucosamine N-acyltransferase [Thermoanaerobaculales bacterium]|nr:UDP-3-O-(3-hydroxymyristoyl)glucosamine N-acyltransferase [Thermoanaerobaculales bacterium]
MSFTLSQINDRLGGTLKGDGQARVQSVRSLDEAGPGDICVVWQADALHAASRCDATCIVTLENAGFEHENVIEVADPRLALAEILILIHSIKRAEFGVEPGAHIAADVVCNEVYVAAGARIATGVQLGRRVEVHANAVIGAGVKVGEGSIIHANATLCPGVQVGRRVVIHSNAVIGSDGFGYQSSDGSHRKIPQVGTVVIEDDVEIGAGTTIDRATLSRTIIRRGTKIDNLVQIAHNCDIGEDCVIVAQAGIAGSTTVGAGSIIGAQAGVADHVVVGRRVRVGAKSGVADNIPEGDWIGSPALPAVRARRALNLIGRLPEIYEELRSLRKTCSALEEKLDQAVMNDTE